MKQLLWLIALSAEKAYYRRVYDAGLVSPKVLDQVNLLVSLKSDAVKRGDIPPDPEDIDPGGVSAAESALSPDGAVFAEQ